jgi:hypothetical protein
MDMAAAMVDRFNRLCLRTLRQVRDLRRSSQQIVINQAGQLYIGQQQVNAREVRVEPRSGLESSR